MLCAWFVATVGGRCYQLHQLTRVGVSVDIPHTGWRKLWVSRLDSGPVWVRPASRLLKTALRTLEPKVESVALESGADSLRAIRLARGWPIARTEQIYLSKETTDQHLEILGPLPAVDVVWMQDCSDVTREGIAIISRLAPDMAAFHFYVPSDDCGPVLHRMDKLTEVSMVIGTHREISPQELPLERLEGLTICFDSLSDTRENQATVYGWLSALDGPYPSLARLDLVYGYIGNEQLKKIVEQFPNLVELRVKYARVDELGLPHLEKLSKLVFCDMGNCVGLTKDAEPALRALRKKNPALNLNLAGSGVGIEMMSLMNPGNRFF